MKLEGKLGLEASENLVFQKLSLKLWNLYEKVKNLKSPQKLSGNRYEAEIFRKCLSH